MLLLQLGHVSHGPHACKTMLLLQLGNVSHTMQATHAMQAAYHCAAASVHRGTITTPTLPSRQQLCEQLCSFIVKPCRKQARLAEQAYQHRVQVGPGHETVGGRVNAGAHMLLLPVYWHVCSLEYVLDCARNLRANAIACMRTASICTLSKWDLPPLRLPACLYASFSSWRLRLH